MSVKNWTVSNISASPRLIPNRKDLNHLIDELLKTIKADSPAKKEDVLVLSDLPEVLFQEFHHPQDKPLVCFYSISDNYFVSFNWIESYRKQKQIILWIQDKDETSRTVEKKKFPMMDQVPPIEAMVHTGSYHMLIAYCGDMCLRLFGDHHRAFRSLCTVPCQFSINCLCYDSETEMLLSGTLGAVVTWLILPGGKGLQMAQTVSIPSHEFVQGFSLHGPQGSLLVLCENTLRAFAHQGPGQLEEVKKFTPVASGSPITCSYTCIPRGYLYAGNKTGEIHAWSLDHDHFLHSFQAHSSSVICVHSRPDMYTLLTAGSEGTVREWTLTSGDLLRQLDIDEELKQLQFIDNNTFFCQTNYTFSLYHLPYFYSLFSVCGSAPQLVKRLCCGPNWARILCATEDGLWRFLSPVTGELLLITWPLLLDKTEVWAYDSDREELFVATRSSDVLVFDATRSPCTAKYLMCMSVNAGDSITCLLYGKFNLGKDLQGLILCGHESGMVRTLSHYSCARIEETLHSGAVLALSTLDESPKNSLLCSYGMDSFVHLIEVTLQGYKVILKSLRKIFSSCPLKHVILLPSSVGAITENLCWRLWYHQDFLGFSGPGQGLVFRETKRLHQCAITSFDVCLSLNIFVTGAIDGSVRIWNFHGKLITELNSVLPFGPLCFANNHGDLLLTFNQSLYLVSCLKLLPPGLLTHLVILNMADEIQEVPRPFMPSFFFSFETVFVPKFVYLGHGLQELQGLETLVNQRAIAFDNSVPHVVEEETSRPQQSQRSKGQFLEEKETDQSEAQRPPRVAPARLLLTGWDGLNPYRILRSFFGRDRHWPFAPDGYIPNSVVRARLWPEGTPIFLRYDMHAPCQKEAWAMTEPFRGKAPSPLTLEDEKDSAEELVEESQETKGTTFGALLNMTNQNWVGRKFSEELIDNLIEAVLNLTIYCSAEKYKKYLSILAHVLGTSRVRPRSLSLVASRLLDDTTHYNPHIRVLAWEGLDRLGLMNHLFAIPLAMNLMDSDERVRIKALYLMTRVAGVRTKSMLVRLLKTRETWKELQQKRIGEESMSQLFGVQGNDIQALLVHIEEQLNENLSLSHKEQQCSFPAAFDIPDKPTLIHKSKIKKQLQIKSKRIMKRNLRVPRKHRYNELEKVSSFVVSTADEGKETEDRETEHIETDYVAPSPVPTQNVEESKEFMVETTGQDIVKDGGETTPQLERQMPAKELWETAWKRVLEKPAEKVIETKDTKAVSHLTTKEPKKAEVSKKEKHIKKTHKYTGRGLAGTPGHKSISYSKTWRDDICQLVTSRIASSHPGIVQDLGKELVDLAQVILADRQPSWDLFQEICPLLKNAGSISSKGDERAAKEPPIIPGKEAIEEAGTLGIKEHESKKAVTKSKVSPPKVKKKKVPPSREDLGLETVASTKKRRKLAAQEGGMPEKERKLPGEKKTVQEKWVPAQTKLSPLQGEMPRGEITKEKQASSPKKRQLAAQEKKKFLRRVKKMVWNERKSARDRKKPAWRKRAWNQEEGKGVWAKEAGLPVSEGRKLAQEGEELAKGKKEPGKEKKVAEEKEDLLVNIEKQVRELQEKPHKKGPYTQGEGRDAEDKEMPPWKRADLAQEREHLSKDNLSTEEEGLSWEERTQVEEDNELAPQQERLLGKEDGEAHGMKEAEQGIKTQGREEEEQEEEQGQEESPIPEGESEAEETKQPFWERPKLSVEEEEMSAAMETLSDLSDKQAWEEERSQERETAPEGEQPQAPDTETADAEEAEQVGDTETWSQGEKQARGETRVAREAKRRPWKETSETKRRAREENIETKRRVQKEQQAQKEERQAQKAEKEAERGKQESRVKAKLGPEKPRMMEEEEQEATRGRKGSPKKEKWFEKATETQRQGAKEKAKQTPKEELKVEQRRQRTWPKEKVAREKEGQGGKTGEESLEREQTAKSGKKRPLGKTWTQKPSKWAKEKRHVAEKGNQVAGPQIARTSSKGKVPQEKPAILRQSEIVSQEERKVAFDDNIKERGVRKKKGMIKKERAQALAELRMDDGVDLEESEASSRETSRPIKHSQLLRSLAQVIRELSKSSGKMEIAKEESSSIMERKEADDQEQGLLKEQEEAAEEDKELAQKESESRMASQESTLTEDEGLEEGRGLAESVREKTLLDTIQADRLLKEVQEQNIVERGHPEEFLKGLGENESEEIAVRLLENIKAMRSGGLRESLIEKKIEEGLTEEGKEERLTGEEDQEESLSMKKKGASLVKEGGEVSWGEEKQEKEQLPTRTEEGSSEEEGESLSEEEEEEEESWEGESLSEGEEEEEESWEGESLSEGEEVEEESWEGESLSEGEEVEEESWEGESLSEGEEVEEESWEGESLSEGEEVEEESLGEEGERVREEGEEEEMEKLEESQDEGKTGETDVERLSRTELSKGKARFFKQVAAGKGLVEKREATAKREMLFKRKRLLDGKRRLKSSIKEVWPEILGSVFKTTPEEETRVKVLEDHLAFEGQDSQLPGIKPVTKSSGRQGDTLLQKARGLFSEAMETSLKTQIPESLQWPGSQLPGVVTGPQTPGHTSTGDRWKWALQLHDSQVEEPEIQAPGPTSSPEMPMKRYHRASDSEISPFPEDWIHSALRRLEAGEQLPRDILYRLRGLLRTSHPKGDWEWLQQAKLKLIAKHLSQNLELSHTKESRADKDILRAGHLKVLPPIRGGKESRWVPLPIPEPVFPSTSKTIQAESYSKKPAHLFSTAIREIKQTYPIKRDVSPTICPSYPIKRDVSPTICPSYPIKRDLSPTFCPSYPIKGDVSQNVCPYPIKRDVSPTVWPSLNKKSLPLIFQKDFWALGGRVELPKFPKVKKKSLPTPAPGLPLATKKTQAPKAIDGHLLGEPYRSERVQQVSTALREMESRHYPAARVISTGAHNTVNKQTLALVFQKELWALKGTRRCPKLPKLGKQSQPISKKREEIPQWETFVALYHILRMLQQRYAKDNATWMEQFYQLMDLYQLKSPRIQKLLLELLQREQPQPREILCEEAQKTKDLVLGERLLCRLLCGGSHGPAAPLAFHHVVPLPGKNEVHTLQPVGIAQYGFLELAWKSLPQVNPCLLRDRPISQLFDLA